MTRPGDEGETSLLGGMRVRKDDPHIEALGDLDEASSALGLARALCLRASSKPLVARVQHALSLLMAEVAAADADNLRTRLTPEALSELDAEVDCLKAALPAVHGFILPGETPGSAALDLARAVIRRAERRVVALNAANPLLVAYLNRLSLLVYLLARAETYPPTAT